MDKNETDQSGSRISETSDSTWILIGTRGRIGSAKLSRNSGRRGGVWGVANYGRERSGRGGGRCELELGGQDRGVSF